MLLTQVGIAGYATDGFAQRFRKPIALVQMSGMGQIGRLGKLPTQAMAEQVKLNAPTAIPAPAIVQENYGLSVTCDTSFTLSPDCRTSDAPEILVWGDSFAMQLVPGILASQPEARLIQMTKSACGPFFDAAPIVEPAYPASWSRQCLAFTEQLRTWLKKNKTIRYAVLASPFSQYLMEGAKLMLRDGEHYPASATLAMEEFQKTLTELQSLGITPVLFAPPPAADWDLGRCLTRAEWLGIDLEKCNFRRREIVPVRTAAYAFLEYFSQHYRVIWLNKLICDQAQCKTHLGSVPLYRDAQHLTQAGASLLGQQHNFYRLITED